MIRMTSDIRHAFLEIVTDNACMRPPSRLAYTPRIAVVDLSELKGAVHDLSDKGGRSRAQLHPQKDTFAAEWKAMLLQGDANGPPTIPTRAVIGVIDASDFNRSTIGGGRAYRGN